MILHHSSWLFIFLPHELLELFLLSENNIILLLLHSESRRELQYDATSIT